MSDINQHLLRRKIAKKKSYLNTKLKTKKQFQKMTEKEGYKVIPLPEEDDPMFQKRMNIYSEIYGKADEETQEKGAQKQRQKSQQRQNNHAAKAAAEAEAKTKEEIERQRAKSQKERAQSKKRHMERTKKGQPVMKNVINSLLAKVQKSMQKK